MQQSKVNKIIIKKISTFPQKYLFTTETFSLVKKNVILKQK